MDRVHIFSDPYVVAGSAHPGRRPMTTPVVFDVQGSDIRFGQTEDGTPYSVAADFARALGYTKTQSATDLLDDEEKGYAQTVTPGGTQRLAVIYEDGMWELIFRSSLAGAKAIKAQVKAILKQIRETGSYSVAPAALSNRDLARMVLEEADRADAAEHKVAELEPAAHSWNTLAAADGDFSVGDAAKILSRDPSIKLGRNRLFGFLHELGWAYVQNSDHRYRTKQYAVERGWLSEIPQSHYHPRTGDLVLDAPQLRVTVKGLSELHKRLGGTAPVQIPSVPAQGGAR